MSSVAELKERHIAATETLNSLKDKLQARRLQLLDTDGIFYIFKMWLDLFVF